MIIFAPHKQQQEGWVMRLAVSARKRKLDREQISSLVGSLKLINSKLGTMNDEDKQRALKTKSFIEAELYAFDIQYKDTPNIDWREFRPMIMEIVGEYLEHGGPKSNAMERVKNLTGVKPCLETFRSWVRQYKQKQAN